MRYSRRSSGLVDRVVTGDVNDLDDSDPTHERTQFEDFLWWYIVAELDGVHSKPPLLIDDGLDLAAACEKESGHSWWHAGGDLHDAIVRDDTWTAGHFRDQANGVRAVFDGERGFFYRGYAAHLEAWPLPGRVHADQLPPSEPFNSRVDVGHGGGHLGDQSFVASLHAEDLGFNNRESPAGFQDLSPADEPVSSGRTQEVNFELD